MGGSSSAFECGSFLQGSVIGLGVEYRLETPLFMESIKSNTESAMIHIGTYNWAKTIGTGQFYCPKCLAVCEYRHRSSRPFLTIYFIPVIPIGSSTNFLECSTCKLQYPESMNEPLPASGDFSVDLLQAVCLTILSDGVVDPEEVNRAIQVLRAIGNSLYSRDEIDHGCDDVRSRYRSLGEYLWRSKSKWIEEEKFRIIQAIFLVASESGYLSRSRLKPLAEAGRTLGLSRAELEECIVQAEQVRLG